MPALEKFKSWEPYPGLIISGLAPWLDPFLHVDLINNRWRPAIDIVSNGIVVIAVLFFLALSIETKPKRILVRHGILGIALAVILGFICYIIKRRIHLVDPDWLWLANVPWAVFYVGVFLFLAWGITSLLYRVSR